MNDKSIYKSMYGDNATIALTISNMELLKNLIIVNFTEQDDVVKRAKIDLEGRKVDVITLEDPDTIITYSDQKFGCSQ